MKTRQTRGILQSFKLFEAFVFIVGLEFSQRRHLCMDCPGCHALPGVWCRVFILLTWMDFPRPSACSAADPEQSWSHLTHVQPLGTVRSGWTSPAVREGQAEVSGVAVSCCHPPCPTSQHDSLTSSTQPYLALLLPRLFPLFVLQGIKG